MGYSRADYAGKPVIAILNTWSDINPCHQHFRTRAEEIKRGVWEAGGFPVEIPALSLSENFQKPTTMLYRNLLAMETEELLRSYPADGAVLMGGCDKTTPGLMMGALSMGLPMIYMPAGAMLRGNWHGQTLGSGTDAWKYWAELRAGNITEEDWAGVEAGIARSSPGTCMTMGTAATMMSAMEALGFTLPGASSIPAVDSRHAAMATMTGRRIVDMVWEDLKPSQIISAAAVDNSITTVLAMAGSTNAVVHLLAIAHRAGIPLKLDRFDELARRTPVLANMRPAGKYLMEDFYYAGGLPALLNELGELLDRGTLTVNGATLGENVKDAKIFNADVIHERDNPLVKSDALVVLRGNLAPDGAVIEAARRRGAPAQAQGAGGRLRQLRRDEEAHGRSGPPGRRELGLHPPERRARRRSGHARVGPAPRPEEAAAEGRARRRAHLRLAHERDELRRLRAPRRARGVRGRAARPRQGGRHRRARCRGAEARDLHVSEDELAKRRAAWTPPKAHFPRGYGQMFSQHIKQANEGCDFDFLEGTAPIPEPAIN